jgi:DNA polymerase I-like protein with 3'-5' exonuclease and polymerase domains
LRRFALPYWKEADTDATKALYRAWRPDVASWATERFYCGLDAAITFMLHAAQEEALERTGMQRLANEIVSGAALALVQAEDHGMPLDAAARDHRLVETRAKQGELERFVHDFTHERHDTRFNRVKAALGELEEQREAIADRRSDERKALTKRAALARTRLRQIGVEFDAVNDNHWRWLLFGGAESGGLALRPTRITGKSGAGGVDKKDIAELQTLYPDVPVLRARVELKHLDKKATWLASLEPEADGRVHFGYMLHRTPNGQVASGGADDEDGKESEGEGNAQNIPEEDRSVFVAEPGMVWVEADYSQIDLRCMAWLAKDLDLLAALRDGVNVHAENAAVIFGCTSSEARTKIVRVGGSDRSAYSASKAATHGWDFGMGDTKGGRTFRPCESWPITEVVAFLDDVSRRTGGNEGVNRASYERRRRAAERSSHPEAENAKLARRLYDAANSFKVREWRVAYFKRWKGLAKFQEEVVTRAERSRELTNPFGRVLPFHGFRWDFREKRWVFMERETALAFLPASSRNDIVKAVMPTVAALARKLGGALLTMTHDSLSAQVTHGAVNYYARAVKREMEREWPQMGTIEGFGLFSCPVSVKVGANWGPASESNKEGLREWRAA